MRVTQLSWNENAGWRMAGTTDNVDLVLYFGTRDALACGTRFGELRAKFGAAHILGCSTGGQIQNGDITDDEIAGVALSFDATKVRLACAQAQDGSRKCGEAIGRALAAEDLAGVFVLSDGLHINGSALVAGITATVGERVSLTGGMAGDGANFKETLVGGDCAPRSNLVAAVGLYGNAIRIGHGSEGGWDQFGPRRCITRSQGNVLFELDGRPALDLYERYLGDEADGLPGTGLLFPLRVHDPKRPEYDLVRTILAVDRKARSMTFAGDVPEGWTTQLMRGNFHRLAKGAATAARHAAEQIRETNSNDGVAILVSCIGRRLLMGQHTVDEVDAASAELAAGMPKLGFYSYGEISPHGASGVCQLHNQTMTVTAITEAVG